MTVRELIEKLETMADEDMNIWDYDVFANIWNLSMVNVNVDTYNKAIHLEV